MEENFKPGGVYIVYIYEKSGDQNKVKKKKNNSK